MKYSNRIKDLEELLLMAIENDWELLADDFRREIARLNKQNRFASWEDGEGETC